MNITYTNNLAAACLTVTSTGSDNRKIDPFSLFTHTSDFLETTVRSYQQSSGKILRCFRIRRTNSHARSRRCSFTCTSMCFGLPLRCAKHVAGVVAEIRARELSSAARASEIVRAGGISLSHYRNPRERPRYRLQPSRVALSLEAHRETLLRRDEHNESEIGV